MQNTMNTFSKVEEGQGRVRTSPLSTAATTNRIELQETEEGSEKGGNKQTKSR